MVQLDHFVGMLHSSVSLQHAPLRYFSNGQMGIGRRTSIPLGDILSETEEEAEDALQTLALA